VYQWVAEIQEERLERTGDAVVHYHLLVWLPEGVYLPAPDTMGWWRHGSTRTEPVRNAVGYMVKYTSKLEVCDKFPRGLRLHGRGGMGPEVARQVRAYVSPRYVRDRFGVDCDPSRTSGGGWCNRATGELILPSEVPRFTEWIQVYGTDQVLVHQVCEDAQALADHSLSFTEAEAASFRAIAAEDLLGLRRRRG
jgi:hypothetical protein